MTPTESNVNSRLEAFCESLQAYAVSKCEKDYVGDLRVSCRALDKHPVQTEQHPVSAAELQGCLREYLNSCRTYFEDMNLALFECVVENGSSADQIGLYTYRSS